MSRSYKKHPFATEHSAYKPYGKRLANKQFRKFLAAENEDMPNRSSFKKYTESWDICDYKSRMTKEEAIKWYLTKASEYIKKHYPTLELWLKYWAKCYKNK